MQHRYAASVIVGLIKGILVAAIIVFQALPFSDISNTNPAFVPAAKASGAAVFGINGAVSSLSSDSSKQTAVNKLVDGGFGWDREEFVYASSVDFSPHDAAYAKTSAAGVKTLGLLGFPNAGISHEAWQAFVTSVVSHYPSIPAWEVMNEADVYLSASSYTAYLIEAHDIIKSINSGATIVLSGITSRIEATNFWDGVAAAGGWGYFDEIGLHIYHSGNPESVNFGGGDIVGEIDRVVGNINKNGGGKKIWVTETGYQSGTVGDANQGNWLARSLVMMRSVSSVDKIFIYRLYENGDTYGLLNSSFQEKSAFGVVKNTIANIGGLGTGSKLTPQTSTMLDNFDAVSSKWVTTASSNSTTTLSSTAGYKGNGMRIAYNFTADQAYAVAQQSISISGTPTAIAAWFYGDDTKNVWKFRFTDKNNETFQTDLGSLAAGWSYKQFSIGTDTAWVSWGGDGKIDFPISFNSFVVDRMSGGAASASGIVDELIAITGSADLYAYQFGSTVAYWKASGSATATLCGTSRNFTETPQFATGVNCSDTPTAASSSGSSTKKKSVAKAVVPLVPVDTTKSYIRLDGENIVADGQATFRIVVGLKDASGKFLTDRKPSILLSGGVTNLTDFVLVGTEYFAYVSSTDPGERTALIKADGKDLGSLKMTFVAATAASPTPTSMTSSAPVPLNESSLPDKAWAVVTFGGGSVLLLTLLGILARRHMLNLHFEFFASLLHRRKE